MRRRRRRLDARCSRLPLDGAGAELRLRLVNGWVWINDVDTGAAWVTSPQQRLDRVEDWGNILSRLDDDDSRRQHRRGGRRGHHRGQPGRPERRDRAVRRDRRGRPEQAADRPRRRGPDPRRPPDRRRRAAQRHRPQRRRARRDGRRADGRRRRRADRPGRPQRAGLAGRRATPAPVTFGYTITDGRDASASASVAVEVAPSDGSANRPPEAHNDIASTRRGRPTTFDVLGNDVDPDGDALVLDSIALKDPRSAGRPARARPVGSGRVHARPEHDVGAHRADVHGQRRLRRHRRGHGDRRRCASRTPTTSPTPATTPASPSSASRSASTSWPTTPTPTTTRCSSPSSRRSCARPTARSARSTSSLTPDGELFFNPDAAGTYVFNYSAHRRRGDRRRPDPHRGRRAGREPAADADPRRRRDPRRRLPPRLRAWTTTAIPTATSSGSSATTSTDGSGLTVKEVDGVGYLVTVAAGAPARPTFRYRISDGRSDPVSRRRRRRRHRRRRRRPAARRPRRRHRGARRRQGRACRCWRTTTTPRAAPSRSST